MNGHRLKNDSCNTLSIKIGTRARKDIGDIDALAASIQKLGMLHPIIVNADWELIAGYRRLMAAKKLNWNIVPVRIVDTPTDAILALIAERDENSCRESFTPSEMVELGRKIESLERPAAKERQEASRPKKGERIRLKIAKPVGGGKFPPPTSKGKTRDKVAAALGISGKTYEKAKRVVEAAEQEPERFAPIVAEMEATGKVDPAYRQVVDAKKVKVSKPQLFDEDLSGPARAKLMKAMDAAKEATEWLSQYVDDMRAEKLNPHSLPEIFADLSKAFANVAKDFSELANTPLEDISKAVLSKYCSIVHAAINNDSDPKKNAKRNVAAAIQLLRKTVAS